MRRRLRYLAVVLGVVAVALFTARGPLLRWWTARSGEHLTVEEAQRLGLRLDLPPEASDVRFYQHLQPDQVVVVDFALSEEAFLKWAERQDWTPAKVSGSITIWPRAMFGDRTTKAEVTDGWFCDTLLHAEPSALSVVYDRKTGRAYYQFQSNSG